MCLCFHILNSHTFWFLPVGQTLPHSLFLVWNHQLAPGSRCCRRWLGGKFHLKKQQIFSSWVWQCTQAEKLNVFFWLVFQTACVDADGMIGYLQMQRWQSRKWCRKVFCLRSSNFSKTSADNFGCPANIEGHEYHNDLKMVILLTMPVLVYNWIPSPQGLGPQWEVGASGNFESFVGSQLLLWLRLRKLSFNKLRVEVPSVKLKVLSL